MKLVAIQVSDAVIRAVLARVIHTVTGRIEVVVTEKITLRACDQTASLVVAVLDSRRGSIVDGNEVALGTVLIAPLPLCSG